MSFELINSCDIDPHHFRVYEVQSQNIDEVLTRLAREYIGLRTYQEILLEQTQDALTTADNGNDFDMTLVQSYIKQASIPARKGGNLDVVRSDFGELLCYWLLERDYQTLFGPKSIRDRELVDLPGRGIDIIGVEAGEPLTLVLGEAKVSNEASSPPKVVDYNADSLQKQHLQHLRNEENRTVKKVWQAAVRTRDKQTRNLLLQVASCYQEQRFDSFRIMICGMLVRPITCHKITDFGSFKRKPIQYAPATIRFLIACLPDDIDAIINRWYAIIQNTEVSGE